jgi:hypothetical protein
MDHYYKSDVDKWATRGYNESNEVARATALVTEDSEALEDFLIVFKATDAGATMHLGWEKVRVTVPFTKSIELLILQKNAEIQRFFYFVVFFNYLIINFCVLRWNALFSSTM